MTRKEKLFEQLYELECKCAELKGRELPSRYSPDEISCYTLSDYDMFIRDSQRELTRLTRKKKVDDYWAARPDEKESIIRAINAHRDTQERIIKEFTDKLNNHFERFNFKVKSERASASSFDIISTLEHHGIFDVVNIYYDICYGQPPHLEFSMGSTGALFPQSTDATDKAKIEYVINAGRLLADELETGSIAAYHKSFIQEMSAVRHLAHELQNKLDNPNLEEE